MKTFIRIYLLARRVVDAHDYIPFRFASIIHGRYHPTGRAWFACPCLTCIHQGHANETSRPLICERPAGVLYFRLPSRSHRLGHAPSAETLRGAFILSLLMREDKHNKKARGVPAPNVLYLPLSGCDLSCVYRLADLANRAASVKDSSIGIYS